MLLATSTDIFGWNMIHYKNLTFDPDCYFSDVIDICYEFYLKENYPRLRILDRYGPKNTDTDRLSKVLIAGSGSRTIMSCRPNMSQSPIAIIKAHLSLYLMWPVFCS